MNELITQEEKERIAKETGGVVADAVDFRVVTKEEYEMAVAFRREIKKRRKAIWDRLDSLVVATRTAYEQVRNFRDDGVRPLDSADKLLDEKMKGYVRTQRELEAEARAVAQAELRKLEEANRAREVQELKDAGETKAAEQLQEAPLDIPQAIVPSATPEVQGAPLVKRWKAELIEPEQESIVKLCAFIATNPNYSAFVDADLSSLRAHAVATKGKVEIPGVRFWQEESVSIRGVKDNGDD